jgi:hypothetical protein
VDDAARLAFCSIREHESILQKGAIIMPHPYFTLPATPEVQRHARRIARIMVIGYSAVAIVLTAMVVTRVTFVTSTTFVTAGTSTASTSNK